MKRLTIFAVLATAAFSPTAFAAAKLDEAKLVRLLECRPESADMKAPALDGLPTLGDKHPLVRSKAAPSGAQKLPKPITANGISGDVVFATGYTSSSWYRAPNRPTTS
ncbi:hypothetical protein [Chitinolyticbacter albus]|uniref:hypothetical protein n=1 Tax=Chitinolyticbacter albus TaxID=2961951 RepID=UPI00210DEE12|nr:hypothetical protein [Chitinolyticbacter albus]